MPSEEAPDDDQVRSTYNFAPGYNGIVYRPEIPDAGSRKSDEKAENTNNVPPSEDVAASQGPKYKLQAMKWGKTIMTCYTPKTSLYPHNPMEARF